MMRPERPGRAGRASVWILATLCLPLFATPARAIDPASIAANTWVNINVPTPYPDLRGWNQGMYDPINRAIVHYDGFVDASHPYTIYSNSIWNYDLVANRFTVKTVSYLHGGVNPGDWYPVANCVSPCQTTHPYDRHPYGGFVYDTQDNVFVLFGGVNARSGMNLFGDTWVYNPATVSWTNMTPSVSPGAREEHCMVYAPSTNQVILFESDSHQDVWAYHYPSNTWTRKDYPGQLLPPARRTHSMVWLPTLNKVMLFGGKLQNDSAFLGDTWLYDPATNVWSQVTPALSPPPRLSAGLAYDTRNQVVVMHGGYGASGPINDTWVYHPDTNRWEQLNPPNLPSTLGRQAWHLAYDQTNGVFMMWESGPTMWAFKYVPSGQPSDQVLPAAVRDLRPR